MVLGQHLKKAMEAGGPGPGEGLGGVGTADLSAALRAYEQERMSRVFPIQIKAYMIGFIGQLAFPPVRTTAVLYCNICVTAFCFLPQSSRTVP